MQQIINFVFRNKTTLLFLLLFGVSLFLTIQSHSYHKSKFIHSANYLTGGVFKQVNGVKQYFNLKDENDALMEENRKLKMLLYNIEIDTTNYSIIDSTYLGDLYKFRTAEVYKNSYALTKNYLTINKGKKDSIMIDFGVVTSKGIVGIIENTSRNYASVLSVLNTKSRINAQLKKSNHIGSLIWDAKSSEFVQLVDVSKFAKIKVGDTIITGGQSTIFPQGILIGSINSFYIDAGGDTYTINVKLFNDMTNIGHVYIIENLNASEVKSLEHKIDE